MKKVMITGGAGFIGVNLIRYILAEKPDWHIINFDMLTYAGNLASLASVEKNPNYTFVRGDVTDTDAVNRAMKDCWGVMHLAAESHVDRSIDDPGPFLNTNVIGTQKLLDAARGHKIEKFLQVSTDEVYGSLSKDDPPFTEDNHLDPNSPYSASKTSGDLLAKAYHATYGLPVVISRCSNNYGPYQFPEKLIPLLINNAKQDKPIPVYGDGMQVRDWIYVTDHCRGLVDIFEKGRTGEVYNLGGNSEMYNLDLIKLVLKEMKKSESLITFVKDRLGHDRRYAMDNSKITSELGWEPQFKFEDAIKMTVNWYLNNLDWVNQVISGDYLEYYKRQYVER
ncbi:MAG: dTDP-glucose 4,6-dehydratase [Calditrichaeota bacterium]|nr:dTDP-glucose 4,6-dehydratase [Calditrichota bacterium]MBT7618994.1 dTDP-glucose 4,6-dehydratase [Calditrichota bacterium]